MSDPAIYEKVGQLIGKVDALHARQDKTELLVKDELKAIHLVLTELNAYMNQAKGAWYVGKAIWVIGGMIGGSTLFAMAKFLFTGSL